MERNSNTQKYPRNSITIHSVINSRAPGVTSFSLRDTSAHELPPERSEGYGRQLSLKFKLITLESEARITLAVKHAFASSRLPSHLCEIVDSFEFPSDVT